MLCHSKAQWSGPETARDGEEGEVSVSQGYPQGHGEYLTDPPDQSQHSIASVSPLCSKSKELVLLTITVVDCRYSRRSHYAMSSS